MEQWLHRGEIKVSSNFLIFIDSFVHVSPFDPFSEDTAASYCRTTTKSFKTRINDISSFINLYLYLHNIAVPMFALSLSGREIKTAQDKVKGQE